MKQIINVNYRKGSSEGYDTRKYSYYCSIPEVAAGELVIAPTAKGDRIARVCEIGVPESRIEAKVLPLLKEVTAYAQTEETADTAAHPESDAANEVGSPAVTALIEVKQLPIIEEQLRGIKTSTEARVRQALSLACTEETYKVVKRARSELNAEFKALEARRQEVRKAILAPYDSFNAVYKECVGDIFTNADCELKARITEVEDGLKQEKGDDLEVYFTEYAASKAIPADLISLEKSGVKVTMSESKTSLQKQVAAYIDRIADELALIETQEHKEEIFVEYQKTLNITRAISSVVERHKAVELARRRREELEAERAARTAAQEKVEAIAVEERPQAPEAGAPPIAAPAAEPVDAAPAADMGQPKQYGVTFKVTGTLDQLRALKEFMNERGLVYEQLS